MSLPYFPMYPGDFEAKTSHLTLAEDGAYNRLLRICWMTPGGTMPADEAWVMRRARAVSDEERQAVKTVLSEFFSIENGRYSNARLCLEFEAAKESYERRKNAGSKGGKAKSLKTNNKATSNAKPMLKQPEPEPEPYKKEEDTYVSLQVSPAHDVAEAIQIYNSAAQKVGWPEVQKLTPNRSRSLKARMAEVGGIGGWRDAIGRAEGSDFLCGRTTKPWTACGFDWIVKATNFTKLMEGNYDNRTANHIGAPTGQPNRVDPALEQIARLAGICPKAL